MPRFETPRAIRSCCIELLEQGDAGGVPAAGLPELRRRLAERLRDRNGISCSALHVAVTPGERFARFVAIAALCGPGDEVILPVPCRPGYRALIHASGATCVELRTRREEAFELDPGLLESAVTGRTRLLILNTPSYPAGTVYRRSTLEAIAEVAARCNWFFCTLCKKREENSRIPCAVKLQSGINGSATPAVLWTDFIPFAA